MYLKITETQVTYLLFIFLIPFCSRSQNSFTKRNPSLNFSLNRFPPKVDTEDFQAFAFKSIDPHFTRSFSSTIRFVYLVTLLVRLIGSDSPRPRRISARWIEQCCCRLSPSFWGEIADKNTEPVLGSKYGNYEFMKIFP